MTSFMRKARTSNWGRAATITIRSSMAAVMVLLLTFSVVLADGTPNDGPPGEVTENSAIIDNGTIQIGVRDEGNLNVGGGTPANGYGTTNVGLRYMSTNGESTSWGCLCEGWGVADAGTMQSAWADAALYPYISGLALDSFTSTASEAESVVTAFGRLRVTHDYHPSAQTPYLYEVTVTIENISGTDVTDLRYTRAMDWDISPTPFSEYVTIQGFGSAANLLYADDNGFQKPDPLLARSSYYFTGNAVDSGPSDHGALFDFGFGVLPAMESISFTTFYGAAGNEADALSALGAVGAEVYSLGQSSVDPATGTPNTFIFAFSGVGGDPIINEPPTLTVDAPSVSVSEGLAAANSGTVSDADGDTVTLSASVGTVTNNNDGTWSWSFDSTDGPDESQTVTISADDGNGGTAEVSFELTVNNVAPSIDAFSAPGDPVNINDQPITAEVTFSDPGDDVHDVTFDWGDGSSDTLTGATSPASAQHTYADPGVYEVLVRVEDEDGGFDEFLYQYVVIFDPSGGFVTGGGWIDSPAGAYLPNPELTGKANFGFVSKYKKGHNVPTGQTQFQFQVADLNFHSTSYEYLVVNQNGKNAQFKGEGTINGAGSYMFIIWATDDSPDTFRIKIWDDNGGGVIYDNGAEQALGGGSIVVHKAK